MVSRRPRKLVQWPILVSVLVGGFLTYSVVPLARLTTTYVAIDIGVDNESIALLSAVFALLPVCLTFQVGRMNDRGKHGIVATCGAIAILCSCLLQWLAPPSLPLLLVGTALLGMGQAFCLTALQIVVLRSSTRAHRDAVLANFMVVMSLAQAVAPLFLGLRVERHSLFAIAAAGAIGLVFVTLRVGRLKRTRRPSDTTPTVPIREIGRTRGLPWIILVGSICVAAQDLVITFLPVLGAERGIPAATIGVLLATRALAAMVSRAIFGRAVKRFGRMPVTIGSAALAGTALLALMLPLPVAALAVVLAAYGFGLGIAITSSVALTVEIAPGAARATALSLRLSAMRLTQFLVPFLASVLVAPLGVAGVFGMSGVALLGAAAVRPRSLSARR